jgi:hypothetical protein
MESSEIFINPDSEVQLCLKIEAAFLKLNIAPAFELTDILYNTLVVVAYLTQNSMWTDTFYVYHFIKQW